MFGFGRAKPRQFNYQPRYYDPKKEERELRHALNNDEKDEKYIPGSLIKKGRIKRMTISDVERAEGRKALTLRLIIFLLLLSAAVYFLFTFTGFEVMVEAFRK